MPSNCWPGVVGWTQFSPRVSVADRYQWAFPFLGNWPRMLPCNARNGSWVYAPSAPLWLSFISGFHKATKHCSVAKSHPIRRWTRACTNTHVSICVQKHFAVRTEENYVLEKQHEAHVPLRLNN